ncbi:nuclear transport factor 2 family protein [Gordonia terrae]
MTSIPQLPPVVRMYLDTTPNSDPTAVSALFTPDAVVVDDGHSHVGRAAIVTWRTEVAAAFSYTATQLRAEQDGDAVVVVQRIEGDFPGGRVDLTNRFTVGADDRISSLHIEPVR